MTAGKYLGQREGTLVDFRICGRVRVRLDEEPPPEWRSIKVRGLLGALLTIAGKPVLTSTLVDWLWGPEEDPQHPPRSLHNHVSRLRAVLREMNPPCTVDWTDHGYLLDVDRDRIDYHRARRLLSHGRSALRDRDYSHARDLLQEALELAELPPLLELDTPRAMAFRHSTQHNLVLPLINSLAESHLGLDEPEAVLALLDELPTDYDLNVTLLKRRIDALRALHRHDEATGRYLNAWRTLQDQGMDDEAADLRAYAQPVSHAAPAPRPPADDVPHYRSIPQRLPHDRPDLVGRRQLLSTLDAKTDRGRASKLIVLTGMAGIGKTALALHWAHRDRDRFPGGRLYIDLHGFSQEPSLDADTLTRRLLNDFQSPADTIGDAEQQRARLSRFLAGRHTLLVLDNLAEPSQISPLLDLVSDTLVLVTSRRRHDHLATHWGAEEVQVPTLNSTDAGAWLRETIGTRTEADPDAFAALVSLSAGIPLALRIIGKYAHDRPHTALTEVVDILRTEHRLLAMGDASDPEHTSLRASFQLSYRDLREPTQHLFRMFGLHPTPQITLGAATALTDNTRMATRALLDELIQTNLLDQEHGRYRLHDLVHEFAIDTAESAESPQTCNAARLRLAQWYFQATEHAARAIAPHREAIPPLESPVAVQADEFSSADDAFRWIFEHRAALLAIVRATHETELNAYSWRIANLISDPLERSGNYHDARKCLEIAYAAAQRSNDSQGISGTLNNLGHIHLVLRDFARAEDCFTRSYTLFQQLGWPRGMAVALHNLAAARLHTAGPDDAHRLYSRALDLATRHQLHDVRAGTLRRIGHLLLTRAQHHDASVYLREALAAHHSVGNTRGTGEALSDLAELHLQRGDPHAALDYAYQALTAHLDSHDRTTLADTCRIMATAHHARGDDYEAIEPAREAVRVTWDTGDLTQRAPALDQLAASLLAIGKRDAAIEGWLQANDLYRQLHDPRWIATTERLRDLGITGA